MLAAVVLSGRVCAGKTTLAGGFERSVDAHRLSTRDVLKTRFAGQENRTEREALQQLGRELDARTGGRWVADAAEECAQSADGPIVVDAVRIGKQIDHLAARFSVTHIHLTAPTDVLAARYAAMREERSHTREPQAYNEISIDPTECQVERLAERADLIIDTALLNAGETHAAAAAFLRNGR